MKLSCWKNLMTENFNARVLGTQKCFSPSLAAIGTQWCCTSIVLVLIFYYLYC